MKQACQKCKRTECNGQCRSRQEEARRSTRLIEIRGRNRKNR